MSRASLRPDDLAARALAGDVGAGARIIRWLEDADARGPLALDLLFPSAGNAHLIGITGPPGAGKSTLVDAVISELRKRGLRVGVLAIDPTSPFSGGAILGDRVRMQRHSADPGVFIRSMATRGQLGGLGKATWESSCVLDAMGYEIVLIETVGVGQDELDVARLAHTTAVVSVPGLGDEVQAIKAGILEIGDVHVLNKGDREGAEDTERELATMLHLQANDARFLERTKGWQPPLLRTVAATGERIPELVDALFAHRDHLDATQTRRARDAARNERFLSELLRDRAEQRIAVRVSGNPEAQRALEEWRAGKRSPYATVEALLCAANLGDAESESD